MIENERTPSLDKTKPIQWQHYNYPPRINLMHFQINQIPSDRKFIVISLFALHLTSILACILNFIDNCIEGGLGILYSLLFMFVFVPFLLYLFYRGLTGICRKQHGLKIYLIVQPIAIILEITISIIDVLGFNGFMRVSEMFDEGKDGAGILGLFVSLIFLGMAIVSSIVLIRIIRERKTLLLNLM